MRVTLTKSLNKFVTDQVEDGHFSSANEIVIQGLQLLEERELKLHALQNLICEGQNSELLSGKEAMKKIRAALFKGHGV